METEHSEVIEQKTSHADQEGAGDEEDHHQARVTRAGHAAD